MSDQGRHANADSELDLAVLGEGYADPFALFELSGEMAELVACPVDLLGLRTVSTVMQHQTLIEGERV